MAGTAVYASRVSLGREHPCSTAIYSFDNGPFAFEHTYNDGKVGPFAARQTKDEAASALSRWPEQFILPMEMSQADVKQFYLTRNSSVSSEMRRFLKRSDRWIVAIWTGRCGYVLYKPSFVEGELKEVFVHKGVFDGL